MSVINLEHLFRPRSVAVIGASNRPGRVGSVVMRNLLAAGFAGPVMPVNPKHASVAGVLAYPSVDALPLAPDLAVIATPAPSVPQLIEDLGRRGTRAAVVLTAGLARRKGASGSSLTVEMLSAARPFALRILGPNCLGHLVPAAGLNASFSHLAARPGSIAFISQSGALCTAVLDWAQPRGIGFSHFVSLGDGADVDFGDVLDFVASEPETRSILLYIEAVTDARKFLSAARAAARNKVVLVIKAGRVQEGARAAASHTGALAGSDEVYDAALRRAGMLRVFSISEIFNAVETLARVRPPAGDDLAIVTNGGGPGVLATDALISSGGRLSELSCETVASLDQFLPEAWSRGNPVDIVGDADAERYERALAAVLADQNVGSVLVMHVPTAISSSIEAARAVVKAAAGTRKGVLTSWLGSQAAEEARRVFSQAGMATYTTPENAVRAFLHLVHYRRNQELLMETPPSGSEEFRPDAAAASAVIRGAVAERRRLLAEPEARRVLEAYSIPVVESALARSADEAAEICKRFACPVAIKVVSAEISHKSDVGGVVLGLESADEVRAAVAAMTERLARRAPQARIDGFTVQRMVRRDRAHELIVGVSTDPTFGPVILFGQGGTAVEVIGDRALALPPLNVNLARELVSRTRVARLLKGYRDRPAVDLDAVLLTLIKVSQMVVDIAELVELDINPLLADEDGVLALDARVVVEASNRPAGDRLAIRPYPSELEEWAVLSGGRRVLLRPIRPEDEPAHHELLARADPEDIRFRFFGLVRSFPHTELARFTQIDYEREMAFIGTVRDDPLGSQTLGVVRAVTNSVGTSAQFAIIVRSDLKGQGLGRALLEKMIRYLRLRGVRDLTGQVLEANAAMLSLAERLGFRRQRSEAGVVDVLLAL